MDNNKKLSIKSAY